MKNATRLLAVAALLLLLRGALAEKAPGIPKPAAPEKKPDPISDRHYRVYDAKGNPAALDSVLQRMQAVDVVFLGESHDDPVAHFLQANLLRQCQEQGCCHSGPLPPRPLALALEMFERDVQPVVDEYLTGLITEKAFRDSSRPWNNYEKDYRPLVEYARTHKLAVIAANAPRRYVNRVSRLGAAALLAIPNPGRRGLPPLPYGAASPAYAAKFNDLMKKHTPTKPEKPKQDASKPPTVPPAGKTAPAKKEPHAGHGIEAQSLWDATMAYSLADFLLKSPRARVIHVNGSFHSEKRMGIPEHLLRYRPGTSLLVVTMVAHKCFPKFDVGDLADAGDFVIVTDPALPRSFASHPPPKQK